MTGEKMWPTPEEEKSEAWISLVSRVSNWGAAYHPPLLPILTFHGTGSASPTLQRLPSCLTVTHPSSGSYFMLDCGEGASSHLSDDKGFLRGVFVGHRHHDHAGGIAEVVESVLKRGNRRLENGGACRRCGKHTQNNPGKRKIPGQTCACRPALYVIADDTVRYELDCLMGCSEGRDLKTGNRLYHTVDLGSLDPNRGGGGEHWGNVYDGRVKDGSRGNPETTVASLDSALGGWKIKTFPTLHCYQSHGCILTLPHPSNFKICYTGDTRPHGSVPTACNLTPGGVDLLVHEATFLGDMSSDALAKRHSTDEEARRIFERCNAKAMVMTHFSQRYGYREGATDGGRVGLDGRIRERVEIMVETNRIIRGGGGKTGENRLDEDENEIDIE
ncbi:hypothetical protein TrRE_jg12710 [Triparma retinervis]|uniref:ribonuclease Z n=1 Tax=Triparma retinervis TaxID=2557542 RepID=A0A9W7E085_9STRA|nr:hypothetical protein TrRE_jg12710 [Triparma retinervis]